MSNPCVKPARRMSGTDIRRGPNCSVMTVIKKMALVKGPFCQLVVPVSVPIDDHGAVTAVIIPATMQATIMTIELRTGAAELTAVAVVAVHVPVATDAHAELFGA